MSTISSFLSTKLYVPPMRPGVVSRPRLLQKMDLGLKNGSRLTLITAPAGYGKTTLALEWLQSLKRPFTWLSLGREDNHPVQFITYLLAALGQVDEKITPKLLTVSETPGGPEEAAWLQSQLMILINHLASHPASFVLVLDDYHTISDLAIHQALGFLLEHQPPQMHLLLNTRQDPLLPLSRLRSRGQLTEIRLGELRFNQEEAEQFLNETMRLDLPAGQVAALEARTEGWIAGLQLAALSLSELPAWTQVTSGGEQRAAYIQAFTGDDRHVMDYLMDEVLSHQPEEVQRFLLQTSVLKRLCGPLCEAVLGAGRLSKDSPTNPSVRPAAEILDYLDRSNLFMIPLDNRRQWYRYHHLFSDLLGSRLQSSSPDLVADLHCRASQWYEAAGMHDEAVDHALLAEDFDRALRLIEHAASTSIWSSGDLPVLLNWSRRLPEDVLMSRPRLSLYYARALFFTGQVMAAESYLQGAETALAGRKGAEAGLDELWGVLYTNQATIHAMSGDWQAALKLAALAEPRVPPGDLSTHARIAHAVGMAEYLRGEVRPAEAAFARAAQLALQANNRNLGLDAVSCQALALILSGQLSRAGQICLEALSANPEYRLAPAASAVYLALAQVQYERNELSEALQSVETSLELGRKAGWPHVLWQAGVLLAQVRQARGDPTGAREALEATEQTARRYEIPYVSRRVAAARARLELAQGNGASALGWAGVYLSQEGLKGGSDQEEMILARVLMAQTRAGEALPRLESLLHAAEAAGRAATVIEALTLLSLCHEARAGLPAAVAALFRALTLAEPEGFKQIFLNSGEGMARLLSLARQSKAPAEIAFFIGELLSAFAEPENASGLASSTRVSQASGTGPDALVEPLSERELEVLGLIAAGLSNPEIAARLYLSVNTLRAHSSNIYQKLGVHNRVQAASRGRELGLLPKE